jgi:hypothetical protein
MYEMAEVKPTHSGTFFSPALLPFLLISYPNLFIFNMNYIILGIMLSVRNQEPMKADSMKMVSLILAIP